MYDKADEGAFGDDAGPLLCTDTMMHGPAERERLAREVLDFAISLL